MNLIMAADELYAAFVSTPNPTPGQKEALKEFADASNHARLSGMEPTAAVFAKGDMNEAQVSIAISLKRLADSLDVQTAPPPNEILEKGPQ